MNQKHTLDFDAFSTDCVATVGRVNLVVTRVLIIFYWPVFLFLAHSHRLQGNNIYSNVQEAVFIEQSAVGHTVVANTLGPNNSAGVAVFNNAMNTTCGPHVIAGNNIFGNARGVSVGSTAPKAGAPDVLITVVGNRIRGNGVGNKTQGVHTNGAQLGTLYVANDNPDGISAFTQELGTQLNISFIDPLDREIPLNY